MKIKLKTLIESIEKQTGKKVSLKNRVVLTEAPIDDKDWERMLDLVVTGKSGEGVANTIKDKKKAMARFVAGLKLSGDKLQGEKNYRGVYEYERSDFAAFGNKAIELGATPQEIEDLYNKTTIPPKFSQKKTDLSSKKLSSFAAPISKTVLKAGFDIKYLPHNQNALTRDGMDAMSRNGRKWTMGYKTEISLGNKKWLFAFDAVTDEGGGPTYYIYAGNISHDDFQGLGRWKQSGVNEFTKKLAEILQKLKASAEVNEANTSKNVSKPGDKSSIKKVQALNMNGKSRAENEKEFEKTQGRKISAKDILGAWSAL